MELKTYISTRRIALFFVTIVLVLTLASLAGQFAKYYLGYERAFGFINLMNVDNEASIATWYSSAALLFCSILLAVIAIARLKSGASYVFYWAVLAILFLGLSLDEIISIHDRLFESLDYTLMITGLVIVTLFGLLFLKFILNLPPRTRYLFIISGIVFIAGAVGFEYAAMEYWKRGYSLKSMTYAAMSTAEEFLEMIGVVIFIYALIDYMNSYAVRKIELHIDK